MKIKAYEEAVEIRNKVDEYEVKNFRLTETEDRNKDFEWHEEESTLVGDALEGVEFYVEFRGNEKDGYEIVLIDGQDDEEQYEVLGTTYLEALKALKDDWDGDGVYFWSAPEFGEDGWAHELILPNGEE